MGSAASPFIVDDAIVGLAQPLTEALNQFASGPRRACDLIEELGRREDFYLDLAGVHHPPPTSAGREGISPSCSLAWAARRGKKKNNLVPGPPLWEGVFFL